MAELNSAAKDRKERGRDMERSKVDASSPVVSTNFIVIVSWWFGPTPFLYDMLRTFVDFNTF